MNNGPSLVLRGTVIGCLVLGLLGWLIAGHIKIQSNVEVAYAASSSAIEKQTELTASEPDPTAKCEVNLSYPEVILRWCEIITRFAYQAE
ncbi:MAG TPA: hypothetical protein VLD65_06620, partial [Anaerolineales bacterium]|nr:hypothetical protein [Anaerolineales bacterium]